MKWVSAPTLLLAAAQLACKARGATEAAGAEGPNGAKGPVPAAPAASDSGANSRGRATEDVSVAGESFTTERWSFDVAKVDVSLADLHLKEDLSSALAGENTLLAVNGGFFGPGGEPLGFASSEGKVYARLAPRLSGGVLVIDGARAAVTEAESFDASAPASFAIQCRPRLVVMGAPNVKRDDGQRAERTALCVRAGGRTLDVVLARGPRGGPSLFALGRYLASAGCDDALNLDGGPSTGAAWREGGVVHVEPPRGPIRHAVVIAQRATSRGDAPSDSSDPHGR